MLSEQKISVDAITHDRLLRGEINAMNAQDCAVCYSPLVAEASMYHVILRWP